MSANLFSRYIWLIDTIRSYGRITRAELNRRWQRSALSDGQPLARRTFYNYRNAIAELFGIVIECDLATYEYYINEGGDHNESVTDWMLNSVAVGNIVGDASEVAHKIFVEDVPSARQYLSLVINALKEYHPVTFSYHPYTRVNPTLGVVVEPYFLKIFRQRWYMTGRNVADGSIKTYALDRMSDVSISNDTFSVPDDFDAEKYCNDAFGIMFTKGETKKIAIRTNPRRAKYLRALPLHHSQQEILHDNYSIFYYDLKLTGDLVEEILSYGPELVVISPPELRAMVTTRLREALDNYNDQ